MPSSQSLLDFKAMRADFVRTHAHRGDPETSREAAARVEAGVSQSCLDLLKWIKGRQQYGYDVTYKDVVSAWPVDSPQQRFSDLCKSELLERTGAKRDGCAVWRVKG